MDTNLERRLARLEAIEEIRSLRYRYARICDTGREHDGLRTIFTVDAVWDGGERFGAHEGIEQILAHATNSQARFVWNVHYMVAPIIEVDDDLEHASGTWYIWEPCNIVDGGEPEPSVVVGSYVDRYRRVDGEWRIAEVRFTPTTVTPHTPWGT